MDMLLNGGLLMQQNMDFLKKEEGFSFLLIMNLLFTLKK